MNYKDNKNGCFIYFVKNDGSLYAKPNFIRFSGLEKSPEDIVSRLESNNPGRSYVPACYIQEDVAEEIYNRHW